MDRRTISRVMVAGALAAVAAGVAGTPVVAGRQDGLVDVTGTAEGRAQARAFAERLGSTGDAGLRVMRVAHGAYVVAPERVEVVYARRVATARGTRIETEVRIEAKDPGVAAKGARIAPRAIGGTPDWMWVDGDCFGSQDTAFGFQVSCFDLSRVKNDPSSTRDYWALEHSSTAGSVNTFLTPNARIYDAWIAARRPSWATEMSWLDWAPAGDKQGPCQPIGVAVSVLKLPLGGTYEMCEHWDMTWYSEGGRFQNQWKCGCIYPFGVKGDREVAYTVAVSVATGRPAVWTLSQGFLAW